MIREMLESGSARKVLLGEAVDRKALEAEAHRFWDENVDEIGRILPGQEEFNKDHARWMNDSMDEIFALVDRKKYPIIGGILATWDEGDPAEWASEDEEMLGDIFWRMIDAAVN